MESKTNDGLPFVFFIAVLILILGCDPQGLRAVASSNPPTPKNNYVDLGMKYSPRE
jgi:hypothetical protein